MSTLKGWTKIDVIQTAVLPFNSLTSFLTDVFRGFPILRELEIPLNGLRGLKIQPGDYPSLEVSRYIS